jgi:hypothetical protein
MNVFFSKTRSIWWLIKKLRKNNRKSSKVEKWIMYILWITCIPLARIKVCYTGRTDRIYHRPNMWMGNMILQDINTHNVIIWYFSTIFLPGIEFHLQPNHSLGKCHNVWYDSNWIITYILSKCLHFSDYRSTFIRIRKYSLKSQRFFILNDFKIT